MQFHDRTTSVEIRVRSHVYIRVCIYIYMNVCMVACIYLCMHIYIYVHIYTHLKSYQSHHDIHLRYMYDIVAIRGIWARTLVTIPAPITC